MPNKQKMQNYDYFDILDFKDRSDRDFKDRDYFSDRDSKKFVSRLRSDRELQH